MPSYSVSLNAVVSPTGGSIARLDAVCAASANSNYVVVATTANLAVAGGRFRGVALEAAAGNQAIQIVDFGTVDLLGTVLSGTGEYVSVNATGQLVRTVTITAATIGTLENGTVHVNVAIALGGASNTDATSIQGAPVGSAVATRHYTLIGNGTDIRSYLDQRTFATYVDPVTNTGTVDVLDLLQQAIDDLPKYGSLHIPQPLTPYLLQPATPKQIVIYDDTAHGNKKGIRLFGDPDISSGVTQSYTFRVNMGEPNGTAAAITAAGNGGSGQVMATITLGTLVSGHAVTLANAAFWVGKWIKIWNCSTAANNGEWCITSVQSDGVVTAYNAAAVATDYGLGGSAPSPTICWRIWIPAIDLRARDCTLERLAFGVKVGSRSSGIMEINYPPGAGAVQVINIRLRSVHFGTDSIFGSQMTKGVSIARDMVPLSGNSFYATNGAGIPHVYTPAQVDTVMLDDCHFFQAWLTGIEHVSAGAQSKECVANRCSFGGGSQYGYLVPRAGVVGQGGSAHMDFEGCSFGNIKDTLIRAGGGASKVRTIWNCYSEVCPRVYAEYATATQAVSIVGCQFSLDNTTAHRSGEIVALSGAGPLSLRDTTIAHVDTNSSHIVYGGNADETTISFENVWWKGTSTYTGIRCRKTTTRRGHYRFAGTERITYRVNTTGVDRYVAPNQTNLNRAGGYTVDLNEVPAWVVGNLFHGSVWAANTAYGRYAVVRPATENGFCYQCDSTGGTSGGSAPAWPVVLGTTVADNGMTWTCVEDRRCQGDGEGSAVDLESPVAGTSGRFEIIADADPGGDGNTQLGFPISTVTGVAQTQINKDTSGLIEVTRAAGTIQPASLRVVSMHYTVTATDATNPFPDIQKRYGAAAQGGVRLESVQGLSKSNGVPPKNFWTQITHTGGAGATFTWTFGTAEEDTNYSVFAFPISETGAPAAGARTLTAITKNVGSAVFTATDPGGAATVTWHVELRR